METAPPLGELAPVDIPVAMSQPVAQLAVNSALNSAANPVSNSVLNAAEEPEVFQPVKRETPAVKLVSGSPFDQDWADMIERVSLQGVSRMLAINSALESRTDECFFLLLDNTHSTFLNPENEQRIATALSQQIGREVRVQYKVVASLGAYQTPSQIQLANQAARQALAVEQIEQDPNVQQLVSQFSGKIDYDSIEPLG